MKHYIFTHGRSDKAISVDNTHTNVWGARVNAYLCLSEIKNIGVEGLSNHITGLENDAPMRFKEKGILNHLKLIKPTVFDSNLSDSKIWEKSGIWKPSVFGDIMDMPTKTHLRWKLFLITVSILQSVEMREKYQLYLMV